MLSSASFTEAISIAGDAAIALSSWKAARGTQNLARWFTGVRGTRSVRMNGTVGAAGAPGGQPRLAFVVTVTHDQLDPVILA